MKKQLFGLLILVAFVVNVSAQGADQAQVERNLRKHVSYFTSDKLEGRRTGEKGATFAAGYVANMFARYKLKGGVIKTDHGKEHPSFMQSFPYIAGIEVGKGSSLKLTDSSKLLNLVMKKDWAPLGFSPNAKIPYTGLVYAGFGISSQKLKYDDFAGLDVKDKIVLAFDGKPDNDNPHNMFFLFNAHAKAKIAKERGAEALILISRSQDFAKDKQALRFDQTLGETSIPTIVVSRTVAAKLLQTDEAGLLKHEELLNAKAKGEKEIGSLKTGTGKTFLANLNIDLVKKTVDAYNVIGVLPGNHPTLKKEIIVVGAHYDHLGRGGRGSLAVNSTEIHHGADDNASGSSALLELARRFSKTRSNKRTIVFMAFGGEEEGLLGSKYFVNNPTFPLERIVTMVNMDMVGRLTNKKLTVGGIGTAPRWKEVVSREATGLSNEIARRSVQTTGGTSAVGAATVSVVSFPKTEIFKLQLNQDGFGPSDHSSFYGKKIPVLFFFTGTHVDYHKPSDTYEKINYVGLANIANFVSRIVRSIDSNPKRPVYKVAKASGMQGARRGFSVSLGTVPSYADGDNTGLVLDGVREDSPAAKAGVKSGDKITMLAGKEIRNISDYVFVLGEMRAGKEYEIVVMRGTEKLKLKIIPKKR